MSTVLSLPEPHDPQIDPSRMSEFVLQAHVTSALEQRALLYFHMERGQCAMRGWPDLAYVTPKRLVIRELKTMKGQLTPMQECWRRMLLAAGVDYAVWQPIHWLDGTIERELDADLPAGTVTELAKWRKRGFAA